VFVLKLNFLLTHTCTWHMQELDVGSLGGGDEVLSNIFAELMVLRCLRGWPGAVQLVEFGRTSDHKVCQPPCVCAALQPSTNVALPML
jgi:hypothetical protein